MGERCEHPLHRRGRFSHCNPFNARFLEDADAALRAARLTHEAAGVVLCQSGALGQVAAALMAEHGYQRVYAVAGGFDGGGGWKRAGLPWIELPHRGR